MSKECAIAADVVLARRWFLYSHLPPHGVGWFPKDNEQAAEDLFDSLAEDGMFTDSGLIKWANSMRRIEGTVDA